MGYPLVDLDNFPDSAEALQRVSHCAAQRLRVMPLMVSGGRLIAMLGTRRATARPSTS